VVQPEEHDESVPPRCPRCGAFLRPDVVWFGETLPVGVLAAASEAARRCDLFFSIGTSSLVYPAAAFLAVVFAGAALTISGEIRKENTLCPLRTCGRAR
jgi:NAD-dependent deacetylase